jgi:hypothetical protein
MPSYTVISDGFFEGRFYSPTGKRKELHADKVFKKCPSWLKPIKGESAQEKGARTKAENKAKADADAEAKEFKEQVDAVTFATASSEQTTSTI